MTGAGPVGHILGSLSVLLLLHAAAGCGGTRTALGEAVYAGDAARARKVLDEGASPNEVAVCGAEKWQYTTPLICAIDRDSPEIVRLLIERGADVNRVSAFGDTPLIKAAWSKIRHNREFVLLLLDKGASIDATGRNFLAGRTALMAAAGEGKADVVKLLLERGAAVDARIPFGYDALIYAGLAERSDIARMLIAKGADIDYAISKLESVAATTADPKAKGEYLSHVRMLRDVKAGYRECALRSRSDVPPDVFTETAAKYRAMPVKPELPEEARAFRVQAEDAVSRKQFQDAVDLYGKALKIAPWWPEGHFNQALILGEADCPAEAIAAMERYLALVPDAPDARAARDKVYLWKGRLP